MKERTDPKTLEGYLSNNYRELQALIRQADAKANILIAVISAILSIFFNFLMSQSNQLSLWQIITVITLLFISGALALSVLYPQTAKPTKKFSLTYFKDAQNVDVDQWTKKILNSNQEEIITKDMIHNIKSVAIILDKKFTKLRIAYILFGLAIILKTIFDALLWFA